MESSNRLINNQSNTIRFCTEQLMHMMSAQTVLDSVNKYRHGVLIGNFVEDDFGIDLVKKGPNPDAKKITTTKQHHDLNHSLYQQDPIISSVQPQTTTFYNTAQEKNLDSYNRPQKLTTYNIFYQQEAPSKLSGLTNNSKKQQSLNQKDLLYEQTRYQLSNKYGSKQNQVRKLVDDQVPDILTGQIAKPKKELIVKNQNENKHLATKLDPSITAKTVNPYSTYSIIKPEIKKLEEVQYKNLVLPHPKGDQRDILFGHGLALEDFHKRQLATSYDLSYNQKVKPQVQINSFYEPGLTQTGKHFHRQQVYQKNYQQTIPAYGTKDSFKEPKVSRPYQPYTKTYDLNHLKNQYLRK